MKVILKFQHIGFKDGDLTDMKEALSSWWYPKRAKEFRFLRARPAPLPCRSAKTTGHFTLGSELACSPSKKRSTVSLKCHIFIRWKKSSLLWRRFQNTEDGETRRSWTMQWRNNNTMAFVNSFNACLQNVHGMLQCQVPGTQWIRLRSQLHGVYSLAEFQGAAPCGFVSAGWEKRFY